MTTKSFVAAILASATLVASSALAYEQEAAELAPCLGSNMDRFALGNSFLDLGWTAVQDGIEYRNALRALGELQPIWLASDTPLANAEEANEFLRFAHDLENLDPILADMENHPALVLTKDDMTLLMPAGIKPIGNNKKKLVISCIIVWHGSTPPSERFAEIDPSKFHGGLFHYGMEMEELPPALRSEQQSPSARLVYISLKFPSGTNEQHYVDYAMSIIPGVSFPAPADGN